MGTLINLGIIAAVAIGGYEIYKHTGPASRRASVGNIAAVDITKLSNIPPAVAAVIPQGVTSVAIQVTAADSQNVSGNVIGVIANGLYQPLPTAGAGLSITAPRSSVVGIVNPQTNAVAP